MAPTDYEGATTRARAARDPRHRLAVPSAATHVRPRAPRPRVASLPDEIIMVIGGRVWGYDMPGNTHLLSCLFYYTRSRTWLRAPPMPAALCEISAVCMGDGRVVVTGLSAPLGGPLTNDRMQQRDGTFAAPVFPARRRRFVFEAGSLHWTEESVSPGEPGFTAAEEAAHATDFEEAAAIAPLPADVKPSDVAMISVGEGWVAALVRTRGARSNLLLREPLRGNWRAVPPPGTTAGIPHPDSDACRARRAPAIVRLDLSLFDTRVRRAG